MQYLDETARGVVRLVVRCEFCWAVYSTKRESESDCLGDAKLAGWVDPDGNTQWYCPNCLEEMDNADSEVQVV